MHTRHSSQLLDFLQFFRVVFQAYSHRSCSCFPSEKRTYNGLPDFLTKIATDELERLPSEDVAECSIMYLPQVNPGGGEGGLLECTRYRWCGCTSMPLEFTFTHVGQSAWSKSSMTRREPDFSLQHRRAFVLSCLCQQAVNSRSQVLQQEVRSQTRRSHNLLSTASRVHSVIPHS